MVTPDDAGHSSELTESNLPCPDCGSSDALARYDDGHTYCFSCRVKREGSTEAAAREPRYVRTGAFVSGRPEALLARRIGQRACAKMDYRCGTDADGEPVQIATYYDGCGIVVAQKLRRPGKVFSWLGEPRKAGLYGQHAWGSGGKRVVVTEGEVDAVAYCDATDCRWPVVSVPNGAAGARKDLARQIEWLETFDQVVLLFDEDEHGRAAAAECAELLTPGKARIARLPMKDAAEMVAGGRHAELRACVWEAAPYRPDGVVNGADLWSLVSEAPEVGLGYPWPCLDAALYGQRQREIVVWAAGTGTGKSSIVRELAYDHVARHGQRVGIIALESSVRREALAQMALAAARRLHLPPVFSGTPEADLRSAFDATLGTGRYSFHFGMLQPDRLRSKIRYMVLADGARWIFLDHVSATVGGTARDHERQQLDELMYGLRALVDDLGFGLHVVTHLKRPEGTPHEEGGRVTLAQFRSTGSIAQVADAAVGVERDQQDRETSGIAVLRVLKNRFEGSTGEVGRLRWEAERGRLVQHDEEAESLARRGSTEEEDF